MVEGHRQRAGNVVFGIRWDGGKRPRPIVPAAVIAAIVALLLPAAAHARPVDRGGRAVLHTVFVVPAAGQSAAAERLVCHLGGRTGRHIAVAGGFVARVPADGVSRLRADASVRAAAPDARLTVSDSGDDRAATATAIMRAAAGVETLQAAGTRGGRVGIALVDTGVMTLPGLDGGQVVNGPDFSDDARRAKLKNKDAFGHGTHLAGVIAGDAGAFRGVAPGARVVNVKVADSDGSTSLLQVLGALEWIRRNRDAQNIRIVNLSLGVEPTEDGYVSDPLAFAVEALWKSGLVVVTAAGNNGGVSDELDIPAADPYVLAVGALDTGGTLATGDDAVADFSSRDSVRPPDVLAPGTGIVSLRVPGSAIDLGFPGARVGDRYFRGSGTSQAAAVVSGLVALLLEQRPGLDPDQVKALLKGGAGRLDGDVAATGAGRADAAASAALATPDPATVVQSFRNAVMDPSQLNRGRRNKIGAGAAEWNGRRWSGRRWSGRRWSGVAWLDATLSPN
jgi:serine protease AprX